MYQHTHVVKADVPGCPACRVRAAAPALVAALRELVMRCDGDAGIRADGSNIETAQAHAALERAGLVCIWATDGNDDDAPLGGESAPAAQPLQTSGQYEDVACPNCKARPGAPCMRRGMGGFSSD